MSKKKRVYQETGHAVNLDNFGLQISFVRNYGAPYNPAAIRLTLNALENFYEDAKAALEMVTAKVGAFKTAAGKRQQAFLALEPLTTRLMGLMKALGASKEMLDDARFYKRKLEGRRAKAIDPNSSQRAISACQRSYGNRYFHFQGFLKVLKSLDGYASNEADLTIEALETRLEELLAYNEAVDTANADLKLARINRNMKFYAPVTGMLSLAADVKAYTKAVFGFSSGFYQAMHGIRFTRIVRKL